MAQTNSVPSPLSRIILTTLIWLMAAIVLPACSKKVELHPIEVKKTPEVVEKVIAVEKREKVKKPTATFKNVTEKKRAFFTFMKPLVIKENALIRKQRDRLIHIQQQNVINPQDLKWLSATAKKYKVKMVQPLNQSFWDNMKTRIDIIPVEMALVQAANESAWGLSRFAVQGNNYFGQWCSTKGCGIVPNQRSAGLTHEVRRFKSAQESVHAYMRNINRSRAYREFRKIRLIQRQQNQPLDAEKLALGLQSYSERGMDYVKVIQSMIRSNRKLIAAS